MCFVVVCVYIKPVGCPGCLYETKIERERAWISRLYQMRHQQRSDAGELIKSSGTARLEEHQTENACTQFSFPSTTFEKQQERYSLFCFLLKILFLFFFSFFFKERNGDGDSHGRMME
jgi:hypothetical protein